MSDSNTMLRRVLGVDAITCVAAGALMAGAAGPLAELTGAPREILSLGGLSLFPIAALFAWMSRTPRLSAPLAWTAVVGNLGWVAASLAVAMAFPLAPFGYVFVVGQALAVLVLAGLEYLGLHGRQPAETTW